MKKTLAVLFLLSGWTCVHASEMEVLRAKGFKNIAFAGIEKTELPPDLSAGIVRLSQSAGQGVFLENHPEAVEIIRQKFRLEDIKIVIPREVVESQSKEFKNKVEFGTALRLAVKSFLEDSEDPESPLSLMMDYVEEYYSIAYGTPKNKAKAEEILFSYLNRPTSEVTIVPSNKPGESSYSYLPAEHGESIRENWIFALAMSDFSDHMQWAIVDREGNIPVFNYGFN